jgi:hypothetical protein
MKFESMKFKKALLTKRSIDNDFTVKEAVDQINAIDPELKMSEYTYKALESGKNKPSVDEFAACLQWLGEETSAELFFPKYTGTR